MGTAAAVKAGPGLLYIAPIGTAEPTSGSGALPSAWIALGYTDQGSEFDFTRTFDPIEVAEELSPVRYVVTGEMDSVKFALAELTAQNLSVALNGGTISSPSAGFVTFEPPAFGSELRVMLVWTSNDAQELWLFRRVLQTGSVVIPRRKGKDKAVVPVEFHCEIPSDGSKNFKAWIASALPHAELH